MTCSDSTLPDRLLLLEEGFWLSDEAFFRDHVDDRGLLAFPQAGQMHGVFSRDEVAQSVSTVPGRWRDLRMTNSSLVQPTPDVAILSYRADVQRGDGAPYAALVTSGYVRRDGGWRLFFHQHSPLEPDAAAHSG